MPLDGRDFTDLAFFVPGVLPKAQGGQGSALNINSARATNTNFYVDGFNNRNARGAAAQARPNIDALQEFKMEVGGYSAEYGKFAGGILNMALRSGTNDFHGSIFHYLRNGFLPFGVGNSGRNILDGPGLFVINMGLRKNFRFAEQRSLQVRLDVFNLLNRTNFRLPDNYFNNIAGGLITQVGDSGREGGPRVFQAGLTYRF